MVDQKITQKVTVAAESTGSVSVAINIGEDVKLLGYGYTLVGNSTYRLLAGSLAFPSRSDRIGTINEPYMFINPPKIASGKDLIVQIYNGNLVSKTYTVTFIIEATRIINIQSEGASMSEVNTLLCIPTYEQSILLPSAVFNAEYILNKNLKYMSIDIPEGIVLEILNNDVRLLKSSDEIGALEFTTGLEIGTLDVTATNTASTSLRWYIKLIFEE
jgi:hypothetical protein